MTGTSTRAVENGGEVDVNVQVTRRTPDDSAKAYLATLVWDAGLGPRQAVNRSRKGKGGWIPAQGRMAAWARRVHPLIIAPDGPEFLRRRR